MFPKKTVIVVGAGASTEAGFPSSTELKRQIAALLDIRFGDFDHPINGDLEIIRALDKIQQTDPNASDIESVYPDLLGYTRCPATSNVHRQLHRCTSRRQENRVLRKTCDSQVDPTG